MLSLLWKNSALFLFDAVNQSCRFHTKMVLVTHHDDASVLEWNLDFCLHPPVQYQPVFFSFCSILVATTPWRTYLP